MLVHPMGEKEFEQKALVKIDDNALEEIQNAAVADMSVSTPGGRFQVRWDEGGSATALGQLPFFAEYLEVMGVLTHCITMPRKPRVHLPGGYYHVMMRGSGGNDIFFSPTDRSRFLLLLQEGLERYSHRVHAFCLMDNHVHLLIQVGSIPLSRII